MDALVALADFADVAAVDVGDAEGRDPDSIDKTILGFANPLDDIGAFVSSMAEYAAMGIGLVELMPPGPDPAGWVSRLGEQVVPRLAELDGPG